jgi:hypothetical protein
MQHHLKKISSSQPSVELSKLLIFQNYTAMAEPQQAKMYEQKVMTKMRTWLGASGKGGVNSQP